MGFVMSDEMIGGWKDLIEGRILIFVLIRVNDYEIVSG